MRWSNLFIPTLREDPSNVESVSHSLLLRAGFIRQLTAGVYSLLPMAQRVRLKIIGLIRDEMNKIGAQEFMLSSLQPMELWEESGRKDAVSDVMFKLVDRKGSQLALGLTHEEVFTSIARSGLQSYKQLPQIWYQIQSKFRDEPRPRAGLLRVREFTMKDSYSFDVDRDGLDRSFQLHYDAYCRIFQQCGLDFLPVQASSGSMGGAESIEFMLLTESGEDTLIRCSACDYAANLEKAESKVLSNNGADDECGTLIKFATPGVKTIRQLEEFPEGAPADKQIKTLVFAADYGLVIALVLGNQELNESKLQTVLACSTLRQANEEEIFSALGAHPGSLGGCGVNSGPDKPIKKIIADSRLKGGKNMVTGANQDDFHLKGVSISRDIRVDLFADLHTVAEGESCTKCGGTLRFVRGLELGHIFKLGTRYSTSMNAQILTAQGERQAIQMGSYGIGIERLMAAVAERRHDEHGLIWPTKIAPFELLIVLVNNRDEQHMLACQRLYSKLQMLGIDVLVDDRDERAGVKFNDADLIGVPFRITLGKKLSDGYLELFVRSTGERKDLPANEAAEILSRLIAGERLTKN